MSRIGKLPVAVPGGVQVARNDGMLVVTGPRGELQTPLPRNLDIRQETESIYVERSADDQKSRALHGLTRSLLANMVKGVSEGYEIILDIVGVGFRAEMAGKALRLYVGYSHAVEVQPKDGVVFEVGQETNTRQFFVRVKGIDKQAVGQQAAELRALKKPEPYKGKGIRYRGELVRRKAGKSAKRGRK